MQLSTSDDRKEEHIKCKKQAKRKIQNKMNKIQNREK